ncbi:hypothetical protein M419DRAFT_74508, partial [Trichoderma reesei RUT C-30]
ILMPWEELRTGPSSADKTLLLDYISPLLPVSLWMAIRNRHWAVVMSILGQLLILGTTVFSTGLLILEPTQMFKSDQKFQLASKFELNQSADPTFAWAVGPGPAQTYYGINFYGLRYPPGTAQDFVVPEFQVPSMAASNIEYSMSTDGAKVGYDCELLPITNGTETRMPWRSILAPFIVANVTTRDCDIKGVTLAAGPDHNFYHDKNATQNYQAQFVVYPCNYDFDFSRQYIDPGNLSMHLQVYNTSRDLRLFMSVVDLRISPYNASFSGPKYMYLQNVTAALCKPSYELGRFEVGVPNANNGSAHALFSTSAAKQGAIKHFPHGSLAMAVDTTVGNWILGNGGVDYVLTATVPTFFQLMSKKAGVKSIRSFMDPELLINTATDVFKGIAAQALHSIIVQPANRTTTGSITYEEQRLRVKALSTGFMCSFLGLLVIIAIAMIFVRPSFAAPDRPGAALSMATLLASSPLPSWRPMAGANWFLGFAICLPLAIIASLEIVQHFSDVNKGFVGISHSSSAVLATYIPSAIALGVASLYAAMQMMAATFAPFAPLKRGKASAERTISLSLVCQIFPRAFYLSLRSRNFAVAIALFGTFLGSFLSIIVSGLYSSISVPIGKNITLHQDDWFNFEDVNLSLDDNEAAAIDNLVEYLGLNSTRWVSEDLVFNTFHQDAVSSSNSSTNVPLTVTIPAVRPSLNCTAIPNEDRQVTIFNQESTSGAVFVMPGQSDIVTPQPGYVWVGVNTTMRYADWCEVAPHGMMKNEPWMQYFLLPNDTSMAYVGKGSILTWSGGIVGGDGALNTDPTAGIMGDAITEPDNGCPTFTATLGHMRLKKSGKGPKARITGFEQDLATIVCYQNMEQVMTNVTWQLPHFSLDPTQLPKTDERTARLLKSKRGSERFPYLPNAWLNGLTTPLFNQTVPGPNNTDAANNHIDNFIKALVFSKDGRPVTELAGAKNVENLKNMTQRLYKVYMAQAISLNMRSNSTDGDGASLGTYDGVVTTSGHQRLQQNRGPKIALQVVLAVMVACGIATRLLLPVRDVLPHDPCSIAGTATLVAGGELVSRLASSMAELDGRTSTEVLLANGLFSLKWWRDEKGLERYGIDIEPL